MPGSIPGPRNRPTQEEFRERVQLVKQLLASGYRRWEIKKHICEKFLGIKVRVVEHYISHARAILLDETGKPKAILRGESYGVYLSAIKAPDCEWRDKIRAQEAIDRLLGLCEPVHSRQEVTGPNGGPVQLVAIPDDPKRLTEVVKTLVEAGVIDLGTNGPNGQEQLQGNPAVDG